MRIAFVTNKRYPNPRGSSGGLENLREELTRRGHTVFVLASMRGNDIETEEEISRFKVSECSGKRWVWNPWRVRRHLKRMQPDVIHTQQYDGLGGIAREWATMKHVPWVQTVSDLVSVAKSRKVKTAPSGIVAPAVAIGRMLERNGFPHHAITIIPTGVVPKKFVGGDGSLGKWYTGEKKKLYSLKTRIKHFVFGCFLRMREY